MFALRIDTEKIGANRGTVMAEEGIGKTQSFVHVQK
jgi:hypothetical protein